MPDRFEEVRRVASEVAAELSAAGVPETSFTSTEWLVSKEYYGFLGRKARDVHTETKKQVGFGGWRVWYRYERQDVRPWGTIEDTYLEYWLKPDGLIHWVKHLEEFILWPGGQKIAHSFEFPSGPLDDFQLTIPDARMTTRFFDGGQEALYDWSGDVSREYGLPLSPGRNPGETVLWGLHGLRKLALGM